MKKKSRSTKENRTLYLSKRDATLKDLTSSTEGIDLDRLNECKESLLNAYKEASSTKNFANVKLEKSIEHYSFRSIGLHHRIRKSEFNAKDYHWGPYFSDVGRAIASGEQRYFFSRLGNYVRGCGETISRRRPNFEIINEQIREMRSNGIVPNTIIYPVQITVAFIKHFSPVLDWSSGKDRILNIEDCQLRAIWSTKYAELRSFVILDSRAGTWYLKSDTEANKGITIAMGESKTHSGYMEYWVETLAYYKINNTKAFTRINLSK